MVRAKIELQGKGDGWQVKGTTIDYDGQEVQSCLPPAAVSGSVDVPGRG